MKLSGEAVLNAPVDRVWETLLDPAVLVRTIPGCERLEATGENSYAMTVNVGVAAIRGTYSGTCTLTDLQPPSSLLLSAQGSGAPGTIGSDVVVRLSENAEGTTSLSYDADVVVGGMIAGVGQRMLGSVSKRMAGEFFGSVDRVLTGAEEPASAAATPGEPAAASTEVAPGVFVAPQRGGGSADQQQFLRGVAVGAGLVALGVLVGAVAGRRR